MNDTLFCFKNYLNATKCLESSSKTGLFVLAIYNSVLAVPTAAANALVIVAILKTSSLRTPSYLLLTSLAFSDLTVGIVGQPALSTWIFEILQEETTASPYVIFFFTLAAMLTSNVSLSTLTAISVDRYLAIRLKMRYRSVVTIPRTRRIIIMTWAFAVVLTSYIIISRKIGQILGTMAIFLITTCLIVIVVSYTMSFRALKIHCVQTHPQGNHQPNSTTQSNAIDVLKYRKLLKTMVLIVMLVFMCYLPLMVLVSVMLQRFADRVFLYKLLISIVSLHSTLNPVICIARMGDLRHACTQICRKILFKQVS